MAKKIIIVDLLTCLTLFVVAIIYSVSLQIVFKGIYQQIYFFY